MKKAASSLKDLRIPLGLISADFYRSQQAIFKLQGPGKYPPISDRYAKIKQRKVGFAYPLLVRSGALSNSVLGPSNTGSVYALRELSLVMGTTIQYGIYHQSDAPRSKIPLRKFLFIGPEAPSFATDEQVGRLNRWTKIMQDFVIQKAKQSGAFA